MNSKSELNYVWKQGTAFVTRKSGHIAAMYSQLKEFELSRKYFNLAIPILKNYDKGSLASAYNNISTLFGYQNRQEEAIKYLDTAISFNREKKNKDLRLEMAFLFNRGLALIELKQIDKAIDGYKNSMAINKENNWLDNLANDYYGLSLAYERKGNYKLAYDFLNKHYHLKDSLSSEDVKIKVARLTAKNEIQQKELALEKSQVELALAKRTSEKRAWVILLGIVVITFVILFWWSQNKKTKKDIRQSRENLSELTRILLEKNSMIISLEKNITELHSNTQIEKATLLNDFEKGSANMDVLISKTQFVNSRKP